MPDGDDHDEGTPSQSTFQNVEAPIRRLAEELPGSIKFRLLNSLDQFDRSFRLLEVDKEMASFRAITGEEEAAAALIKAIQLRGYPHAKQFNARDHQHKAAVMACIVAIAGELVPILTEFQLTFNYEKRRADVRVPLSNFGVAGGEKVAMQPVEPLDLVSHKEGVEEAQLFFGALSDLASQSNFENIKNFVSAQANARNTLLYASDSALPRSRATRQDLQNRKSKALILLVLVIMILQTSKHQSLVLQATLAFLNIISRLPAKVTSS